MNSSLILCLLLTTVVAGFALWLGRRLGRTEAQEQLAHERHDAEDSLQQVRHQVSLETQAKRFIEAKATELEGKLTEAGTRIEELTKLLSTSTADLQSALTEVREKGHRLKELEEQSVALKMQVQEANDTLRTQEGLLGEAKQLQPQLQTLGSRFKDLEIKHNEDQISLNLAQTRIAELETIAQKDQERLESERRQFEENRQVFRQEFENLAQKIFEQKQQTFSAQSQTGLNNLLEPFRQQLESFRTRVDEVHTENVRGHTSLAGELERLRTLNQSLSAEANNLVQAIKGDKKAQGTWGEEKVEFLLEMAGLRKGLEYDREKNFKDDEGHDLRPDFVVNLPEHRHIIIDSKVSLNAYAESVAAESPELHKAHLDEHVQAIRNHIRTLSDKKYPELVGMNAPDFTFMFIAVEPAYLAAAQHAPNIFEEAYKKRIALVTSTTLLPVLRVVAHLWNLQRQALSTRQLADQGSKVYDKLRGFIEKMEKLGKQIDTAQATYRDSFNTLKDGKGSLVKLVDRFADLGVKVIRKLPTSVIEADTPELAYVQDSDEPEVVVPEDGTLVTGTENDEAI